MKRGREDHACAMRGTDVFVIGGEVSTKNSIEVWNGRNWAYSIGPIGAAYLKLIAKGRNLYLFGGWEYGEQYYINLHQNLYNKIWKINDKNEFDVVGNTSISRQDYVLFTVPYGYLSNCQGM